jgi:predicted AAA+ superfamily ATPase
MINRNLYLEKIQKATTRSPITALLGPRQCGKTTLARAFAKSQKSTFFDLESMPDQRRLQNAEMVLGALSGLVVLDEIQVMPELFGVLRVLVDRPNQSARFLILGSASPEIIKNASESLAGRVEFIELSGFDLFEVKISAWKDLWLRGSFPPSFLARDDEDSFIWREGFIRTFLERDIPQLGINIPAQAMRRFWTMLAHYHAQAWNASEFARSLGVTDKTIRSYLDILTGTFMIRQLQPWYENIGKRQVKTPKIYFRDSGLLHNLLDIRDWHNLLGHPKVGASWEGYALEQILQTVRPRQAYFWGVHSGGELDLMFTQGKHKFGVEIKFSEAPVVTSSMKSAIEILNLAHLWVVYPGEHTYPIDKKITVLPLKHITELPVK